MTPSQIASLTGLITGSVTALLDRLERGTYIRRERDTKDGRKILVVREEEGQQRLAQPRDRPYRRPPRGSSGPPPVGVGKVLETGLTACR